MTSSNPPLVPTIGRIVHFYDKRLTGNRFNNPGGNLQRVELNEQGAGPYAALVIQTFPPVGPHEYVNLMVFAWGGSWHEGSVEAFDPDMPEAMQIRYYKWPPKVISPWTTSEVPPLPKEATSKEDTHG
jgi:hypothetical protein